MYSQQQQQYSAQHQQSILHPNEWTRYDPSQNAYSPLAQFSSYTLREHNETLDKLTVQLETIARKLVEIDGQETEDHRRYSRMLDALQREESDIIALLTHNRTRIEELERSSTNEVLRRREEVQEGNEKIRELEDEMSNILQLEGDLLSMKRSVEEKLSANSERRAVFTREFRHGMTILETDHKEAKTVSMATEGLLSGRNASLVSSPTRRAATSAGPSFSAAVPRSPIARPRSPLINSHTTSVAPPPLSPRRAVTTTGPLRRGSPPRQTASSHYFGENNNSNNNNRATSPAKPSNNNSNYNYSRSRIDEQITTPRDRPVPFDELVRGQQPADPFRKLSELAQRLHAACRDGRHDEIRDLLRLNQDIVREQDPVTGDCALHVLCGSSNISIPAVTEMCLIDSTLLQLFNKQGLTPFHVACLNVMDNDHKLKMELVSSLACDPNQKTGLGETAIHLCARNDYYHHALRCVVERMKVDVLYQALTKDRRGNTQQMNALDVARDSGDAAKFNAEYLSEYFRAHHLK